MTFPHMSASLPQLATTAEVADYLRLTEATVIVKCRRGQIPAVKVGHRWLVNVEALAAQLARAAAGTP